MSRQHGSLCFYHGQQRDNGGGHTKYSWLIGWAMSNKKWLIWVVFANWWWVGCIQREKYFGHGRVITSVTLTIFIAMTQSSTTWLIVYYWILGIMLLYYLILCTMSTSIYLNTSICFVLEQLVCANIYNCCYLNFNFIYAHGKWPHEDKFGSQAS